MISFIDLVFNRKRRTSGQGCTPPETGYLLCKHRKQLPAAVEECGNLLRLQRLGRHTGKIIHLAAEHLCGFVLRILLRQGLHGVVPAVQHQGEMIRHGETLPVDPAHFLVAAHLLVLKKHQGQGVVRKGLQLHLQLDHHILI